MASLEGDDRKRRFLSRLSHSDLEHIILAIDKNPEAIRNVFPADLLDTPAASSESRDDDHDSPTAKVGEKRLSESQTQIETQDPAQNQDSEPPAPASPEMPISAGGASKAPHLSFLLSTPLASSQSASTVPPPPQSPSTSPSLPNHIIHPVPPPPAPHPEFPPLHTGPSAALARASWETAANMPSYEEMICMALTEIGDPDGSPPKVIFDWMLSHFPLVHNFRASAHQALQKTYKRGRLQKLGTKYRLNPSWGGGSTSRRSTRRPQIAGTSSFSTAPPPILLPPIHPGPPPPHPSSWPRSGLRSIAPAPYMNAAGHTHPPQSALLEAIAGINEMVDSAQGPDDADADGEGDMDADGEGEDEEMDTELDDPPHEHGLDEEEDLDGEDVYADKDDPQGQYKASLFDLASQLRKVATTTTVQPTPPPPAVAAA